MYTFDSRIRYSEIDSDGKLSTAALINYFQDVSTFQSEDLGVGVEYLHEKNLVWVLSAWQIVVNRYPGLGERIVAGTLPYEMRGFMGLRNFCLMDEEGNYLAKANSIWTLLDTRAQRPVAVPAYIMDAYPLKEKLEMDYAPRKIAVPRGGIKQEPLVVKKHHLDTNQHVNNQQFLAIAMEYLPEDFRVGQLRAEYKKQAHLGDVLIPDVLLLEDRCFVVLEDEAGSTYVVTEFLPA